MQDSIFTKIIKGEIPGEIIYEDDTCVALLTIEPISEGHCLVVPREQVDHLWDADTELYRHLTDVARIVADKLRKAYSYRRVGMLVEGFGVPHAHIHVLGLNEGIEPTVLEHVKNKHTASIEELAAVAQKLRAA